MKKELIQVHNRYGLKKYLEIPEVDARTSLGETDPSFQFTATHIQPW